MKSSRAIQRKDMKNQTRSSTMIEIVKPPSDLRDYRVVILPNGITTLLISEVQDDADDKTDRTDDLFLQGQAAAALCIGVGSFSDPPEIPGFAHFMEHMVFMGSWKYPKENFWDEHIAKSGGETNATTDCERTCFYFTCHQNSFKKALDIFSQFFICPLFLKESVDREIMAVDSEWQMRAIFDQQRMEHLICHELVEEGHPMAKFMPGNRKSLKEDPERNGINVYEQLHSFYLKMYSAHYMTLVVHSMEPLDKMEETVLKIFTKIPNNGIPRPKFIKPPFQEGRINKLFRVVPSSNIHKMEIIWALPPLIEHYRAKALEFLGLLFQYQGKGSILSYLHRRHLAGDIDAGNDFSGFTHNSTWSAFSLSITLTQTGIERYEEILKTIFQYIHMVKTNMPVHVFEEQKHIQETSYKFHEKESINTYVEELAHDMHMFPFEHYLCGRTLFFEFNEQLIRDCLDFLRPQGMLVMLFSKDFVNLPSLREEPWTHVKYQMGEFNPELIQRLSHLEANPELMLPQLNPYIATNFTLLKVKKPTKYPVVVMNEPGVCMWYKKDNEHGLPNAFIFLNLISSVIMQSAQNIVLSDIFLTLVLHKLTETMYNAIMAGYEYSVDSTDKGITLIIGGNSDKIKLVTRDALKVFVDLELSPESFQTVVAHLTQVYFNELLQPTELARAVRHSILEVRNTSVLARYENINRITYDMLLTFIRKFYTNLFVEGFVSGNLKPQDAADIGGLALTLVASPMSEQDIPQPRQMQLAVGDYKCFMSAINQEDVNSCVVQYFQLGLGNIYNSCLNDLLAATMNEPLFRVLRSENQLGYIVYCQAVETDGVLGFIICVESQANKFSVTQVDEIMETFLHNFLVILEETQPSKIAAMVNIQAQIRATDDADLDDEAHRFWREIVNHNYVFDRMSQEYEATKVLTKRDLIDWCKNLLSESKRKLTCLVEGHSKDKPEVVSTLPDAEVKTIRCLLKEYNMKKVPTYLPTSSPLQVPPDEQTCLFHLKDLGGNYITNINAFKVSLKEYPYHVINK